MILTFICDQILFEIATSIIFDIAKEEGIQDEDYNSPVIDKLLREFQFWNKLIPSQAFENKTYLNQFPQDSGAENKDSMVEDSMGLESNIYQLVQKSTTLFPQETQSQDLPVQNQDNLKI